MITKYVKIAKIICQVGTKIFLQIKRKEQLARGEKKQMKYLSIHVVNHFVMRKRKRNVVLIKVVI